MAFNPSFNGFSIFDYVVFFAILIGSLGIGVYHCIRSNKTTEDFLLASRSMSPVPVALSLVATYISSISILGYVGEVYGHGIQLMWSIIGCFFGQMISIFVFMPVIYPLRLSSINEYLELRFRSPVLKRCVLVFSCTHQLLYLGICLYAPTLALESVTSLKSNTYILILGIVVTLYSSFGGLKAVVWTDAIQCVTIVLGVIIAVVSAIISLGGFGEVWRIATEHGRTDALDFGFGLHTRHTVCNTVLMYTVAFTYTFSFNQSTVQRVGTMPDFRRVKQILYLNCFGLLSVMLLLYLAGLSLFSVYAGCDPISMGYIKKKDQIMPYYVMDKLGYMNGVPGAFVACLFSGTLSSVSSVLNSVPTMLWADSLSHYRYFATAPEHIKTLANKVVTLFLGVIMIALAFMASRMSGLVQTSATILSILRGPILGIFVLGICVPFCSVKGAFAGLFSSVAFMIWLTIGSQLYGMKVTMLPLSTDSCGNNTFLDLEKILSTTTIKPNYPVPVHPLSGFYGISYTFLTPAGFFVCMVVGILASLIAGREKLEEVDPAYIMPVLRKYVGSHSQTEAEMKQTFTTSPSKIFQDGSSEVANNSVSGKVHFKSVAKSCISTTVSETEFST